MPKVEIKTKNYCGALLAGKITGHLQQILPIIDSEIAVFIASKIERDLESYDGIQLSNGTTFKKTWESENKLTGD